jgi:hypothetical protein
MAKREANRRQRTGRAAVGILTALAVAGGGWWLLRDDAGTTGDLDRTELLRARELDEPIAPLVVSGELRLPEDPPFRVPGTMVEYVIRANEAQAAAFGLDAERVRTWGLLVDTSGEIGDPTIDVSDILTAIETSGGELDTQQLNVPRSEFTTITGTWNGMTLLVHMHRGETITVTLVDR